MTDDKHKPVIDIRLADWQRDQDQLSKIRRSVFIEEQNVPEDMEWDEYDEISTHFLLTLNNKPVAAARLTPKGQIGRMAVVAEFRKQGIGTKLLIFVLKNAASKNFKKIYLHAQVSAISFYKKQGFSTHGGLFYEAGIAHRKMCLPVIVNDQKTNNDKANNNKSND